jgi:hypothetical protein
MKYIKQQKAKFFLTSHKSTIAKFFIAAVFAQYCFAVQECNASGVPLQHCCPVQKIMGTKKPVKPAFCV